MALPSVSHCVRDLLNTVDASVALLNDARTFVIPKGGGKYHQIGIRRVELIAGICLLRIHLSWEEFLERTFVRYLCGAVSPGWYSPQIISVQAVTIQSALTALLGKQNYLTWDIGNTLKRAATHFNLGEPYTTQLGAISRSITDSTVVRNRVAHRSDYSRQQFRLVVRSTLGYVPSGISPGRLLMMQHPASSATGISVLEYYARELRAAGSLIVP